MTRPFRRTAATALIIVAAVALVGGGRAQAAALYGGGGQVGDDHTFAGAPYVIDYQGVAYLYATDRHGFASYATDDGGEWGEWQRFEDQPAPFWWGDEPAAVVYEGTQYLFYDGEDFHVYANAYDGDTWSGWEDVSGGDLRFGGGPGANVHGGVLHLYNNAMDGSLYHKTYNGAAWSAWESIWTPPSDEFEVGDFGPYAVAWGDTENVLWIGDDGRLYWNRDDGQGWIGTEAIAGRDDFVATPAAAGDKDWLYLYATAEDHVIYANVFTEEDGWAGWKPLEGAPAADEEEPSLYVYDGTQHVVYAGEDGHGYHATFDGASWSAWTDLGDDYAHHPYQYEHGGDLYLAYTGDDGYVYYRQYQATGRAEGTLDDERA